jgi:hypothetical protein
MVHVPSQEELLQAIAGVIGGLADRLSRMALMALMVFLGLLQLLGMVLVGEGAEWMQRNGDAGLRV